MNSPATHPACWEIELLLADCEIRRQRRSGPGGQHRNKVETGIFIRHLVSGVEASATETRSQETNRRVAVDRLRRKLAIGLRTPVPDERVPHARWISRLTGKRIECSADHGDFPALVAEAFDFLAAASWDPVAAAARLGCTASQLVRLLKKEPAAFARFNDQRRDAGLSALK